MRNNMLKEMSALLPGGVSCVVHTVHQMTWDLYGGTKEGTNKSDYDAA